MQVAKIIEDGIRIQKERREEELRDKLLYEQAQKEIDQISIWEAPESRLLQIRRGYFLKHFGLVPFIGILLWDFVRIGVVTLYAATCSDLKQIRAHSVVCATEKVKEE